MPSLTINIEEDQEPDEEGYQSDSESSDSESDEEEDDRELYVNGMWPEEY